MEDDGSGSRIIGTLYFDLATAYKENNYNAIIILKARIEREERHKINEEKNPLFSHRKGKVLSFPEKINEMNDMYDDLIFQLSDNSNENLKELKRFTTEEVIKFNVRITDKLKRNSKKGQI